MCAQHISIPTPGTPVRGLRGIAAVTEQLDRRVSAASAVDFGGTTGMMTGAAGTVFSPQFSTTIQCFQIQTCWKRHKKANEPGATDGRFWVAYGRPVGYWVEPDWMHRHWKTQPAPSSPSVSESSSANNVEPGMIPLWLPVTGKHPESSSSQSSLSESSSSLSSTSSTLSSSTSTSSTAASEECDEQDWQDVLYPLYGVGQWVWCIWDYAAAVWRIIHAYDDIVRFELTQSLVSCQLAEAKALGFPAADGTCSSGSVSSASQSSSLSSSSLPKSSSASPASASSSVSSLSESLSSSTTPASECRDSIDRGCIKVIDLMGIVTGTLPVGTRGWAKRMADSQCFEIMWLGGSASQDVRWFILRTDLEPGGTAIAQWLEFRDIPPGSLSESGCAITSRLCWKRIDGEPQYFWVFDGLQEFWGYKNKTGGVAWKLPGTPTPEQMCLVVDPEGDPVVNDPTLWPINRLVCPTFLGCPCQDPDVDPCENPE